MDHLKALLKISNEVTIELLNDIMYVNRPDEVRIKMIQKPKNKDFKDYQVELITYDIENLEDTINLMAERIYLKRTQS